MKNVILKMTAILVLLAGTVFTLNQTHASNSVSQTVQEPTTDEIYAARCARCHGEDGKAETNMGKRMGARNFTDKAWHDSTKDEDIISVIKDGSGAMPSFKSKLTEEQIKGLVGKIRKFKPEK